ncbi:hypothetical protein EXN66_Car011199 [Channa argus]|uniref:Uncharacterized protein n=1 Tax=Channa argus TaxID=215402 RepID=A0A6G1PZF3_CHAAH|nr:hypothetical protein EXN66_Car011199 [Channa argus]
MLLLRCTFANFIEQQLSVSTCEKKPEFIGYGGICGETGHVHHVPEATRVPWTCCSFGQLSLPVEMLKISGYSSPRLWVILSSQSSEQILKSLAGAHGHQGALVNWLIGLKQLHPGAKPQVSLYCRMKVGCLSVSDTKQTESCVSSLITLHSSETWSSQLSTAVSSFVGHVRYPPVVSRRLLGFFLCPVLTVCEMQ